ncbi:MAG: hypothetical protein E7258_02780 [Lachnospiraceae bacterium]|nr:hypothetical protein [Lachnospiraceae bacterium]
MAFSDIIKTVKNETSDAIEVTKLKAKISKEKTNIKDAYEEIGEFIYNKYKTTNTADSEIMDKLQKIDEAKAKIDDYNLEISKVKMN